MEGRADDGAKSRAKRRVNAGTRSGPMRRAGGGRHDPTTEPGAATGASAQEPREADDFSRSGPDGAGWPEICEPRNAALWLGGPAFGTGASCVARCGTSDDPRCPPHPSSFALLGSAHAPPPRSSLSARLCALAPFLPRRLRRPRPLFLPLSHTHAHPDQQEIVFRL